MTTYDVRLYVPATGRSVESADLPADQIALAVAMGAKAFCNVCHDDWYACPKLKDTVGAAMPGARASVPDTLPLPSAA